MRRRTQAPRPKRQARRRDPQRRAEVRVQNLARLSNPNFSIKKRGNVYTLAANDVTPGVLSQVRAFLRNKTGSPFINGGKMSKNAAYKYIVATLRQGAVEIMFR